MTRFDPEVVDDVAERFGFDNVAEIQTAALQMMRETNEILTDYIKSMHSTQKLVVDTLLSENENIRKMRAEEQAQHLKALIATQEALDMSAERASMRARAEAQDHRLMLATDWALNRVGPQILKQWEQGLHTKRIVDLVRSLEPEQYESLKALISDEQRAALEALRSEPEEHHERQEPHHHAGGPGSGSGPDTPAG